MSRSGAAAISSPANTSRKFRARGAPPPQDKLAAWAGDIGEIGATTAALGKSFVYLISPSKAAYEPSGFPAGTRCPALANPQAAEKLAPYKARLARAASPSSTPRRCCAKSARIIRSSCSPRAAFTGTCRRPALALREITGEWAAQPAGSPIGAFAFDWREQGVADRTRQGPRRALKPLLAAPGAYPTRLRSSGAARRRSARNIRGCSSSARAFCASSSSPPRRRLVRR